MGDARFYWRKQVFFCVLWLSLEPHINSYDIDDTSDAISYDPNDETISIDSNPDNIQVQDKVQISANKDQKNTILSEKLSDKKLDKKIDNQLNNQNKLDFSNKKENITKILAVELENSQKEKFSGNKKNETIQNQ